MTVEESLEYGRFEAWLLDRGPMAIGIPRVHEACPIAMYLRETAGVSAVRVGRNRLSYGGHVVDLPWWAVGFVRAVDCCSAPLDGQEAANLLKQAWENPPSLTLPRKGGEDKGRALPRKGGEDKGRALPRKGGEDWGRRLASMLRFRPAAV